MLDRDGDEIARATTIVRFDANSTFEEHTHWGGEEFYVLEGVFSDVDGDYEQGTYVRNPINSTHAPWSKPGCTLLVKLYQMTDPNEQQVTIHCKTDQNLKWKRDNSVITGERHILELFRSHNTGEIVTMERWLPGTKVRTLQEPNGEEILLLEGEFLEEFSEGESSAVYPTLSWIRNPAKDANTSHLRTSTGGCLFYKKTGHLPSS